ncbi:DUF4837 family protein [Persicobacter diffluens]
MMRIHKSFGSVLAILLMVAAFGCESTSSKKKKKEYLPASRGVFGQILLVMDSASMKGPIGDALDEVFLSPYAVLPQSEPKFKILRITPEDFTASLLFQANVVRVYSSDNRSKSADLTKQAMPKSILSKLSSTDPSDYMAVAKDVYARGQEVMFLYGNTQEELAGKIMMHADVIQQHFNEREKKRIRTDIYSSKESKELGKHIQDKFGVKLRIPFAYKKADEGQQFIWFRNPGQKIDKSFFLTETPFVSESQLEPDSIIAFRDRVCKEYVLGNDDPDSYMLTQTILKPETRTVDFNGKYAVEIRGLWRLNEIAMGGPYVGYAIVDEAQQKLFYLEGFAYRPGGNKRELIRELEAILWTFQTSDELPKQSAAK